MTVYRRLPRGRWLLGYRGRAGVLLLVRPARQTVPGSLGRRQRGPHWVLHPVATPSRNCD
ncbi:hypothetical protein ACMZ5F_17945 [Streptomyces rhizosphaericola]|uniref:hypothetical protein n=1 Tax=Streptomyces TaxID=1883 RepID=UPI001EF14E10|nr:hypothetical protein [Streptomyces sp. S8]